VYKVCISWNSKEVIESLFFSWCTSQFVQLSINSRLTHHHFIYQLSWPTPHFLVHISILSPTRFGVINTIFRKPHSSYSSSATCRMCILTQ